MATKSLRYKVKCRGCGKVVTMYFGDTRTTDFKDFEKWAKEHSVFPITMQCSCDNGSMLFHDLISYSPIIE
jgi:endogenous inhibitor of DNA gyrase (YacG/DUF329 family)